PRGYELIRRKEGKNNEDEAKITIFPDGKREMKAIIEELEQVKLFPFDRITILPPSEEEVPRFIEVEVSGEVKFPGRYIVQKGERLYDILKRAGGFTERAFPEGIVFLRDSLAIAQKEKLELVSNLLTKELLGEISYYVPPQPFSQALPTQRTLAEDRINLIKYLAERVQAQGRIVVKVTKDLEALRKSEHNIELENGDRIFIPTVPSFVVVAGEVKNPSTFSYIKGKSGKFYINQAGGVTKYANTDEIYIIRASGETSDSLSEVKPGDTVVVPPKIIYPYQTWYIVRDALSLIFQGTS
ncbi:MAG: SLBB domain-containing protein, partial [Fervidobacterium pennivorans]